MCGRQLRLGSIKLQSFRWQMALLAACACWRPSYCTRQNKTNAPPPRHNVFRFSPEHWHLPHGSVVFLLLGRRAVSPAAVSCCHRVVVSCCRRRRAGATCASKPTSLLVRVFVHAWVRSCMRTPSISAPSPSSWGSRQGVSVRLGCLLALVTPWGHSTCAAIHLSCVSVPLGGSLGRAWACGTVLASPGGVCEPWDVSCCSVLCSPWCRQCVSLCYTSNQHVGSPTLLAARVFAAAAVPMFCCVPGWRAWCVAQLCDVCVFRL